MLTFYDLINMVGEPIFINSAENKETRWGILDWVDRSQTGDTFGLTDTDIGYDLNETFVYRTKEEYENSIK